MRSRRFIAKAAWCLSLCVLSACGSSPREADKTPQPDPVGTLAERSTLFEGLLPCADCSGIRYQLILRPDSVFFLRQSYLGREVLDKDDIGRWNVVESRGLIQLSGTHNDVIALRVIHGDTLRLLDQNENEIESGFNYALVRKEENAPFEPRLPLTGLYSYMADAPAFRECSSELRLAVALEGDYKALDQAYRETAPEPGSPLLAEFVGRITTRPATDRQGFEEVVVVEHYEGVWPGETCGAQGGSRAPLENTFWGLVRMGTKPVRLAADQREVHIRFLPERNSVQGFAGCNSFFGSFKVAKDRLTFGALGSTRMACPHLDEEVGFLTELGNVAHFNIVGDHMDMYDSTGHALLRFEARYFR